MYPYAQKSEIEHMIQEMFEDGIILPSQSAFSSSMVMVTKRDGPWYMCLDDRQINKMIITDKFPIHDIDELQGAIVFIKLGLSLEYH
jgi:putative transposase